jgi:DNA repair exonuclease SbcCD ATPase subunit
MPEEKSELQRQLAELSKELTAYRNEIGPLKAENSQIPELKARISSLEKSLKEKNILPTPSSDRSLILEEELARLKVALSQQKAVESRLCQELVSLRASVGRHERSCKNIISVCCNVPLQNVEELIDPLMTALEADGFNLDVGLVSAFLARVRRIIGPIGLKEEKAEAPDSISE